MNILAILYCFPPLQYPATMCYVKLVKGLLDLGVGVDVVTIEPESFHAPGFLQIDESLRELVPSGLHDLKVRSPEKDIVFRLIKGLELAHRLLHRFVEPKKVEWIRPALRMLEGKGLGKYDLILSCSQPHANHVLGLELKKRTGKPWIAYFSDPWSDNVYSSFRSDNVRAYNLKLETTVIREADAVFFTSPEMLDFVMSKFPQHLRDKCGVLPHSFVPEWYRTGAEMYPETLEGRRRILHTGHFYGPRTPIPFFRALRRIRSDGKLPGDIEFLFHGGMGEEDRKACEALGLGDIVRIQPTIPYLESLAKIVASDYLLLIDAPLGSASESIFLPSKLVDYLGAFRPVIGVTPKNGACARVLRETGNIAVDVADEVAIGETLSGILTGSLGAVPDTEAIRRFEYREVTRVLLEKMARFS